MKKTTNKYGIYEVDHTKFGGLIFPSDFNTDDRGNNNYGGSPIADRIARDATRDKKFIRIMEGD